MARGVGWVWLAWAGTATASPSAFAAELDLASGTFTDAAATAPDDGSFQQADDPFRLAMDLMAQRRWAEAAAAFEAAAAAAPPGSPQALDAVYDAGMAWEAAGEVARAIAAYERALAVLPDGVPFSLHVGSLLLLADRPADAARRFAAVPRDPTDPSLWLLARRMLRLAEDAAGRGKARDAAWAEAAAGADPSSALAGAVQAAARADQLRVAARPKPAEIDAAVATLRAAGGVPGNTGTVVWDALGRLAEARAAAVPAEADAWRTVARDAYRALIDADRAAPVASGMPFVPAPSAVRAARRLEALGQ